jgi:GT2 family glycosyltransferase
MISIVTAYYNRKKLFIRTLDNIVKYADKIDYEIIAVDDGSDEHERLEDLTDIYPHLKVIRLEKKDKWYTNACIPFNIGFRASKGDKIIFQNPECMHYHNVLAHVENNLNENDYISFGCFSLSKEDTVNIANISEDENKVKEMIAKSNHVVKNDGDSGWYNHSVHRPVGYHFCAAITAKDLMDLGGFDERFALGYGYDDDELMFRIRDKGMNIIITDNILVFHQNHYNPNAAPGEEHLKYKSLLAEKNKNMLLYVTHSRLTYRANYLKTSLSYIQESTRPGFIKRLVYKIYKML